MESTSDYMRRNMPAALVILTALAVFFPVLQWLVSVWGSPLQPFAGWVAPLVTAALLWDSRERLSDLVGEGSSWGLLPLALALVIYLLSVWMHIKVAGAFAFILVIWALVLLLAGWPMARATMFPIGFLLFMLPWAWLRDALTFPLRLLSTRMAAWLPLALGVPTEVAGTDIWLGDYLVRVDLECSGLSYTISLFACALLLLYLNPTSRWRGALLLLSVFPLSLLANVIRIDLTILLVLVFGPAAGKGVWHTATGIVVFVLVVIMLIAVEAILCRSSMFGRQSQSSES